MNIKFKAWDKKHKEMCEVWQLHFEYKNFVVCFNCRSEWARTLSLEDVELLQFTGLYDKNGKEIYEGDIVKAVSFARWLGVVEYLPEKAAYILKDIEKQPYRDDYVFLSQFEDGFEILGNIYENQDLLTEDK